MNLDFGGVQGRACRIQSWDRKIRVEGESENSVVKTQLRSVHAGPNARESSPVSVAAQPDPLRELSNGSINSQDGGRIWLLCAPIDGLTHCWPPHASYTEFFVPTAIKS
jgi:hypothetical protein